MGHLACGRDLRPIADEPSRRPSSITWFETPKRQSLSPMPTTPPLSNPSREQPGPRFTRSTPTWRTQQMYVVSAFRRTRRKADTANARAMIVYTSGTTGRPKGVVTTHAALNAQIESLVTAWEWTASDRTLLTLPLHHVHGILNVVCCALHSGAVLEMLPKFDSETVWDRLSSGELTVFSAVPTIYHRLIRSWEAASPDVRQARSRGCRALRLMMSGSAALPRTVLDRWHQITGHVLLERYGMTEVGMALSNPLHGERRPGFVGQPLPGVSARIVDGELHLKGPGVFSEYWRQPESTAGIVRRWMVPHRRRRRPGRRLLQTARTDERRHPQERRAQDLRPRNRRGAPHASGHL